MTPSPCPQLSRSSLSSVFDSYSDPIPDSLNRSSSRAPRTCSPSSELSSGTPSLGVSPVSSPCSWLSGPLEEKRKHSSRTPLLLSPRGLVSIPLVPGEQGPGTQALSLIWSSDWVAKVPIDEEVVRGSRGVVEGLARKVISRRLSWEPTKDGDKTSNVGCVRWNKAERELVVITFKQRWEERFEHSRWDYMEWGDICADRIW